MIDIKLATEQDFDDIYTIARQYTDSSLLGFLSKVKVHEHIERNEVHVAIFQDYVVGFIIFHRRRDGITTIYDLATHKGWVCKGIARRLVYSIHFPCRLKVAEHNPANQFYRRLGFQLVLQERGKTQTLNNYYLFCLPILVAGNNPIMPRIANATKFAYGSRHDGTIYAQPTMVDINWKKYDWTKYLELVTKYKPIMAMVPDYLDHSQRSLMLQQYNDLKQLGTLKIMICPKFDEAVLDIPSDAIIAISVPSDYAGFLPNSEDLKYLADNKRILHFLGGSPRQWLGSTGRHWVGDENKPLEGLYTRYSKAGLFVSTVDGNSHETASKTGSTWLDGRWYRPTNGAAWDIDTNSDLTQYQQVMVKSGINIFNQLQEQGRKIYLSD